MSAVPSQPLNLVFMDVTSQSFRISWSPPSDLNAPDVNYTLLLITEAPRAMNTITGIVNETYLFEALRPFTNYTVVIFAVSEKGPGLGSDPIRVMTPEEDSKCILQCTFNSHTMYYIG